jgi:hypothetical protein
MQNIKALLQVLHLTCFRTLGLVLFPQPPGREYETLIRCSPQVAHLQHLFNKHAQIITHLGFEKTSATPHRKWALLQQMTELLRFRWHWIRLVYIWNLGSAWISMDQHHPVSSYDFQENQINCWEYIYMSIPSWLPWKLKAGQLCSFGGPRFLWQHLFKINLLTSDSLWKWTLWIALRCAAQLRHPVFGAARNQKSRGYIYI